MSPYCCNDYEEEFRENLNKMIDAFCAITWRIEYKSIPNPDRKRFQFWKPEHIFVPCDQEDAE